MFSVDAVLRHKLGSCLMQLFCRKLLKILLDIVLRVVVTRVVGFGPTGIASFHCDLLVCGK